MHASVGLREGAGREPGWIGSGTLFHAAAGVQSLEGLNAWLLDKPIAHAWVHRHPELVDQTIWDVLKAERPKLVPYADRFNGFHAVTAFGLEDLPARSGPRVNPELTDRLGPSHDENLILLPCTELRATPVGGRNFQSACIPPISCRWEGSLQCSLNSTAARTTTKRC